MQNSHHIKYYIVSMMIIYHGCLPTVDDVFDETYHHRSMFTLLDRIKIYQGSELRYQCVIAEHSTYLGQGQWSTVSFRGKQEQCPPDVVFQQDQGFQAFVPHTMIQLLEVAPTASTIILHQGE